MLISRSKLIHLASLLSQCEFKWLIYSGIHHSCFLDYLCHQYKARQSFPLWPQCQVKGSLLKRSSCSLTTFFLSCNCSHCSHKMASNYKKGCMLLGIRANKEQNIVGEQPTTHILACFSHLRKWKKNKHDGKHDKSVWGAVLTASENKMAAESSVMSD